jgi:hypothetical protein
METNAPPIVNPYHADYADEDALPGVPFAGRRAVLGRLHHLLTGPGRPTALTIIGRRRLGKTALLRAFDGAFGADFLGAYVPLRQETGTETDFVLALAQAITAGLIAQQLPVTRLATLDPPGDDPRGWFCDQFLPAAHGPARAGRRFVLLLDDADRLAHALRIDRLPRDLPAWLAGLLEPPTALGCALTIDADFEDDLPILAPLADPTAVMRLELLSADETRWLLTEPARGCYTVPDDCAAAVQRATGGHPALVQQFGFQLFQRWERVPELNVVTLDDIRALTPVILKYAEEDYRGTWMRLNAAERLTLTAMSALLAHDPLKPVSADAIAAWLIESDHPLDAIAIGSAFRALEYREILRPVKGGVVLTSGLFQLWLRQNADRDPVRVSGSTARPPQPAPPRGAEAAGGQGGLAPADERRVPIGLILGIGTVLGVIVAAIILSLLNSQGLIALPGIEPAPTVTLLP